MSQASLRISGYFSTPQGTLFPFALSPTHFVDLPPTSVVTCISCSFALLTLAMFGSLPTTLLSYARAAPSPRHVPTTPPARSRSTPVTSSRGPAGHALGSRPLNGPPVTLYTTGPNHARRLMSRHPRPPSWSRRRPDWLRSHPPLRPGPHTLPTTPAQPMETRHQAHGCPLTTPSARMSAAARHGPDPRTSTQLPAPTRPARPDPAHDEGTPPPPLPLYSRPGS